MKKAGLAIPGFNSTLPQVFYLVASTDGHRYCIQLLYPVAISHWPIRFKVTSQFNVKYLISSVKMYFSVDFGY
jgi:hypothetical protein